MSSTNREPEAGAPFTLLFFSNPPRESPALWRTAAAVTAVHALIVVSFVIVSWLANRSSLPDGLTQNIDLPSSDLIGTPITLDMPASPPAAARAQAHQTRGPASRSTPAPRLAGQRIARASAPRQAALLGVPTPRNIEPPSVVPPDIPKPAAHAVTPETFASLPPRSEVQPVAPRGASSGRNDTGSNRNDGNDSDNGSNGNSSAVENMTLDELAREPRFTPFSQAPELINRAEIKAFLQRRYPPYMSSQGIGGRAVLWLLIDPQGGIRKGLLLRSSGNAHLDDAALAAIDRMEFRPAVNKGKPVPVWVQLPVSFQPNW